VYSHELTVACCYTATAVKAISSYTQTAAHHCLLLMTPCAVAYLPYCTVFCILYLIAPIQVDWKEEKNDNTRPAVKSIDRTAGAAIEEFKVRLVANSCTYCLHEVLTWTYSTVLVATVLTA
jgi:hypothetical protein